VFGDAFAKWLNVSCDPNPNLHLGLSANKGVKHMFDQCHDIQINFYKFLDYISLCDLLYT
jgi:hypothetical protein